MIVTPSVDEPELFLTWDAEYALNAVNQGVTAVGIKGTLPSNPNPPVSTR